MPFTVGESMVKLYNLQKVLTYVSLSDDRDRMVYARHFEADLKCTLCPCEAVLLFSLENARAEIERVL